MQAGDRVFCKYRFKVSHYDGEMMTIAISMVNETDYIRIPIYMSGLGFYLPEKDFCIPGSYLPINHPDYYRHEEDTDTVIYNGGLYRLSINDESFYYNGQYTLVSPNEATIVKYAKLRTAEAREAALDSLIGGIQDGEVIDAIVLFMYAKTYENTQLVFDKEFGLKYQFHLVHSDPVPKYYAYIQDIGTGVEFEFPLKYLVIR